MVIWMNSGALWLAALARTGLEDAEFHLYKAGEGIIPTDTLTLAELEAAECDFTGYAPIAITEWLVPMLMSGGGAGVPSGTQQFTLASPYTVPNTVGGGWCQSAAGALLFAWDNDPIISLVGPGASVTVSQTPVFG